MVKQSNRYGKSVKKRSINNDIKSVVSKENKIVTNVQKLKMMSANRRISNPAHLCDFHPKSMQEFEKIKLKVEDENQQQRDDKLNQQSKLIHIENFGKEQLHGDHVK